jgi:hypothetical protein
MTIDLRYASCDSCGEAVDINATSGIQRKIKGWEELRRGGGANKIVGRKPTGEWRHSACAINIPGQESLFD